MGRSTRKHTAGLVSKKTRGSTKQNPVSQTNFWTPLGVTQSAASRYENGRGVPLPLALLMELRSSAVISDEDLADALARVRSNVKKAATAAKRKTAKENRRPVGYPTSDESLSTVNPKD